MVPEAKTLLLLFFLSLMFLFPAQIAFYYFQQMRNKNYAKKKLHKMLGDECWESEEGELMAWNEEDGRIYIYK